MSDFNKRENEGGAESPAKKARPQEEAETKATKGDDREDEFSYYVADMGCNQVFGPWDSSAGAADWMRAQKRDPEENCILRAKKNEGTLLCWTNQDAAAPDP